MLEDIVTGTRTFLHSGIGTAISGLGTMRAAPPLPNFATNATAAGTPAFGRTCRAGYGRRRRRFLLLFLQLLQLARLGRPGLGQVSLLLLQKVRLSLSPRSGGIPGCLPLEPATGHDKVI